MTILLLPEVARFGVLWRFHYVHQLPGIVAPILFQHAPLGEILHQSVHRICGHPIIAVGAQSADSAVAGSLASSVTKKFFLDPDQIGRSRCALLRFKSSRLPMADADGASFEVFFPDNRI